MCVHARQTAASAQPPQAEYKFSPAERGPATPPPLGLYIEFRPESSPHPWAVMWADGTVAAMYTTMATAQAALGSMGNVIRRVGGR